jgi:hypothetical protein
VQRAVWSQRLGGPCGGRGLRLLRVTPVQERMLESLDSCPWLPGLMRPLPSRFEWSGLSDRCPSWCPEAVTIGAWAMESGPLAKALGGTLAKALSGPRPRRRAWWPRKYSKGYFPWSEVPFYPLISYVFTFPKHTGFYWVRTVRPVRYWFDHLSKVVKGLFWGVRCGLTEGPNGAKLCKHVEES